MTQNDANYPSSEVIQELAQWSAEANANENHTIRAASVDDTLNAYRLGVARAHVLDDEKAVVDTAHAENDHQSRSALWALATPVASIALTAMRRPQLAFATMAVGATMAANEYNQMVGAHEKQALALSKFAGCSGDPLTSARIIDAQTSTVQSLTRYGVLPLMAALSFVPNKAVKAGSFALIAGLEGYSGLSASFGKGVLTNADRSLRTIEAISGV